MSHPEIDLTGRRFGRLTVLGKVGAYKYDTYTISRWLCRCDCGKTIVVLGNGLKQGRTRSCGCLRVDAQRERRKREKIEKGAIIYG